MKRIILETLIAIALGLGLGMATVALVSAAPAAAQGANKCAPYIQLAEYLARDFGERPLLSGLETSGPGPVVLEVWGNLETGTFSILVMGPGAPACIVAEGGDLDLARAMIPGVPS